MQSLPPQVFFSASLSWKLIDFVTTVEEGTRSRRERLYEIPSSPPLQLPAADSPTSARSSRCAPRWACRYAGSLPPVAPLLNREHTALRLNCDAASSQRARLAQLVKAATGSLDLRIRNMPHCTHRKVRNAACIRLLHWAPDKARRLHAGDRHCRRAPGR